MKRVETTLLLLRRDNEIMLARKKRGFGKDKYNGVGGKLQEGETKEDAMLRETKEEVGIVPASYEYIGFIDFMEFVNGEKKNLVMYLFTADAWDGELVESEEMEPCWFSVDQIPYDKMFVDDAYWMPKFLNGEKFNAYFEFDENWQLLSKRFEQNEK